MDSELFCVYFSSLNCICHEEFRSHIFTNYRCYVKTQLVLVCMPFHGHYLFCRSNNLSSNSKFDACVSPFSLEVPNIS